MNPPRTIIYLTGPNRAGKGECINYLTKKQNFMHFSARTLIQNLARQQAVEIKNRTDLKNFANKLRNSSTGDYIARVLTSQSAHHKKVVIESIRCKDEVEFLRKFQNENKNHCKVIFVGITADPKLRFQRTLKAGSITDNVTLERFLAEEEAESNNEESNMQNLPYCLSQVDLLLVNDNEIEDFHLENEKKLVPLFQFENIFEQKASLV